MALCFVITFAIYVSNIPHFVLYANPPTGDQPFYLMDVISLVQDGDLNVKNNYEHRDIDKFYDLAPHPPGFVGMGFKDLTLSPDLARTASEPPRSMRA